MEHENEEQKEAMRETPAEQAAEEPKEKKSWFKKKEKKPLFKKKEKMPGEPGFIKKRITQWKRTLDVSRKPSKEEFLASSKITGIGILLLGFIGFVIFLIYHLVVG